MKCNQCHKEFDENDKDHRVRDQYNFCSTKCLREWDKHWGAVKRDFKKRFRKR